MDFRISSENVNAGTTDFTTSTEFSFQNTSANETLEFEEELRMIEIAVIAAVILWLVAVISSLITLCFGVISWTLILKWRRFRNYVFINISFANVVSILLSPLSMLINTSLGTCIFTWSMSSFVYWLLIACITFYVDIVNIFNLSYPHIFLKASIFAWGLPAVFVVVEYFSDYELREYSLLGVNFVNVALYLRVLFALMRGNNIRSSASLNIWIKIRIATFIVLISGGATMLTVELAKITVMEDLATSLAIFLFILQIILVNVLFIMMKSHRMIWREHLKRKRFRNMSRS